MTTGKRTKKPGAGDAGTPEKEGATPAAKAGGAKKEAKPPKKSTTAAAAPKAKEKPAAAKKATAKKAGDEDDLEALESDEFADGDLDDLDDLDDLESEPDEEEMRPARKAAAGGKAKPAAAGPGKKTPALAGDDEDDVGDEDDEFGDDEEEDEEDEEEEGAKAKAKGAKPAAAGKAPAAKRPGEEGEGAPAVVPARRLTPEAKAKLNELLAKGVSLNDALRQAAQWETFVAPVREAMPTMDRMRPVHRPKGEPESERTIDDLDAPVEEEAEEGIE